MKQYSNTLSHTLEGTFHLRKTKYYSPVLFAFWSFLHPLWHLPWKSCIALMGLGRGAEHERALVEPLIRRAQRAQTSGLRVQAGPLRVLAITCCSGTRARRVPLPIIVRGGATSGWGGWFDFAPLRIGRVLPVPVGNVEPLQRRLNPQLVLAQHGRFVDFLQLIFGWLKIEKDKQTISIWRPKSKRTIKFKR